MNLEHVLEITASMIFYAYLLWASWQDIREMQVIRYTHLLGATAVGIQLLADREQICSHGIVYLSAGILLILVSMAAYRFSLYGMADNILLLVCGLFFINSMGVWIGLEAYLYLQAVSGVLLLIVQMVKHNVKGMKLKHSVPYIPYISVAFVLTNVVL